MALAKTLLLEHCFPVHDVTLLEARNHLGVARGPLQERPLQFQNGNLFVSKLGNPCSTLGQLLVGSKTAPFRGVC